MTPEEKAKYDEGTAKIVSVKGGRATNSQFGTQAEQDQYDKTSAMFSKPTVTPPPVTDSGSGSGTGGTTRTGKVSRIKKNDEYSDYVGDQISGNKKSEQQIYNEQKALAQSQIDAIEQEYQASLASETRINQEAQTQRSGQTRALAAASGLVGSQEAGERMYQTDETGRKIQAQTEAKLQAQKANKIAALLGQVRKDASAKYEAQKKALAEGYELQRELDAETVKKAQEQAGYLLKAGVDFDSLKSSPEYAEDYKYLLDTGFDGSENMFKSWYVANKPEKNLVSKTPQIVGNKATWFEILPDNTIKAITVDAGVDLESPDIQVLQGADGFFAYDKNSGSVKSLGIATKDSSSSISGYKFKSEDYGTLSAVGLSQTDLKNIEKDLAKNSLDTVLADPNLSEAQKTALRRTVSGTQGQFLNADYFESMFNDEDLKTAADEAGFRSTWSSWATEKKNFLDSLVKRVEQYRKAGKTDEEILKLMQS